MEFKLLRAEFFQFWDTRVCVGIHVGTLRSLDVLMTHYVTDFPIPTGVSFAR